jgi:pimeloyl-ACP methyl ester carboxylesterase
MDRKTFRAAKAAPRPLSAHRVVLIPGFLGFNELGDFSYFARKVGQALADALAEADEGRKIEVDAVETVPAGSLTERQEVLLKQLNQIVSDHPGARLHLVGHSTGGLDAELLTRTEPAGSNSLRRQGDARHAIRSVITLASPLAGTSLASSPLARFTAIDSIGDALRAPLSLLLVRGPRALLGAVAALLRLLGRDQAVGNVLSGFLHSGNAGMTYVLSLLLSRDLIDDLDPRAVTKRMQCTQEDPALATVHRRRFLTIARREPESNAAGLLFGLLYDATAREAPSDDESEQLVRTALIARRPQLRVLGSGELPELTRTSNDGIVDTCRQVLPVTPASASAELERVAGLVIADHIDVIGYYRGASDLDAGFLISGSAFGDDEFKALYAAIAEEVTAAIRASAVL